MSTRDTLRMATRKSKLAMTQAQTCAEAIGKANPGLHVELLPLLSEGDQVTGSLQDAGGKDLFAGRLRQAMLAGEADCACHSLKDLGSSASEFVLAVHLPRADARDALVGRGLEELRDMDSPVIGTSSPRRVAQLSHALPHAKVVAMRGNVDTRLAKLDAGQVDALVLAHAGLNRLGLQGLISENLDPATFVPAACQGIVVVECPASDQASLDLLAKVDDPASNLQATAERACVAAMGGDCHTALGVLASPDQDNAGNLVLKGDYFQDGLRCTGSVSGPGTIGLGERLATRLLEQANDGP